MVEELHAVPVGSQDAEFPPVLMGKTRQAFRVMVGSFSLPFSVQSLHFPQDPVELDAVPAGKFFRTPPE
ncbi:hypothetical protein FKM82_010127 [Ascaphus truei]